MNNQQQKPQTITLEYIARLKAEKLEEIREQKKERDGSYNQACAFGQKVLLPKRKKPGLYPSVDKARYSQFWRE